MKKSNNVIYGHHAVLEALRANRPIDKLVMRRQIKQEWMYEIVQEARNLQVPIQKVPDQTLDRIVRNGQHQGVIAFTAAVPFMPLEEVIVRIQERGEMPLLLMLDRITDVRNFGAIARTAVCMGAHALIVPMRETAAPNADAVKVSAGALNHIPLCRTAHLRDTIQLLQQYGIRTVACTEKAGATIYEEDFTQPVCLVMGSEENGISMGVLKSSDALVKIPIQGEIESLNVSVAAAVFMAEAARQRQ